MVSRGFTARRRRPGLQNHRPMRICLLYDCLFPYTVGGAERWYRNLAERLADEGHDVTYVTLRQWPRGEEGWIGGGDQLLGERQIGREAGTGRGTRVGSAGVRVRVAGPRMALYTGSGRRRTLPPIVFGLGVFWHLLRHGRDYDVVHTASFPYFSLLAAGCARPLGRYRLVVDWHEVWSKTYWRAYLGRAGGAIGYWVQLACARLSQRAFCFSELHAERLRGEGLRGEVTVLRGEYAGSLEHSVPKPAEPVVVFAGRMIPEKRAPSGVTGVVAAAERIQDLRGVFFGDGPERDAVLEAIARAGVGERVRAPGFVAAEEIDEALGTALCMLLPSKREGYGLIVIEAAAKGTPSIVVAGEDNAATELIEEAVNGFVAADASPEAIADAIVAIHEAGFALRGSTAKWFNENAELLSLESSLRTVLASYGAGIQAWKGGQGPA